jgi:hypothetical protein
MARKKIERTAEEVEQIKAAKREYDRQWRKNNPEKVRAIQERYWLRRFKKMTEEAAGR